MGLTNQQYNRIYREFEQRQIRNQNERRARIEAAYARIPELRELEETAADLAVERAAARVNGDAERYRKAERQLQDLRESRTALLKAAGLPADHLDMHYSCSACRDTGYVTGADGAQREKCVCFKKLVTEFLFEASNLSEKLKKENFRTFSFELFDRVHRDPVTGLTPHEIMTGHHETARAMARHFVPGEQNLLLTGPAGTGKTFLSNCIAEAVMQQGFSVLYMSASNLFDTLAEEAFSDKEKEISDYSLDCDLLIIDDLGTELNNSFVSSRLFSCLNERALRGRSTIISTNMDMNQLRDAYSERVSSRIFAGYKICRFFGPDLRVNRRNDGSRYNGRQ